MAKHKVSKRERFYEAYELVVPLTTIGDFKNIKMSDGYDEFDALSARLNETATLVIIDNKYYIDTVHDLQRLSDELIIKYNLTQYFKKL